MAKPRKGIYFNCDVCGKECYLSENQYNEQKQHCCSLKCRNELRGKNYLPGKKFGKLTVIERGECKGTEGRAIICKCECGNTTKVNACNRGHTYSCGCRHGGKTTHGMTGTPEMRCRRAILERCNNQNYIGYAQYGGRGIKVLYKNFEEFYSDIGPRPSLEYSVDRIDNNRGYEPGNCRWATMKEQSNNKRSNVKCVIGGEEHTLQEWADKLGMNRKTLKRYILKGKIKGELYNYKGQ